MRVQITVVFLIALCASASYGQDVLTLGNASGPGGGVVTVPVSVRDVSGTLLGSDAGIGKRLQGIGFKVSYPAAQISSISFSRAGALQSVTPFYEIGAPSTTAFAYVVSFSETTDPVPFTLNGLAPGNVIGNLLVTLKQGATSAALTIDPVTAIFSNQAGTVVETVASGTLSVVSGSVSIAPIPAISGIAPANGGVGSSVTITGTNFTGATAVFFNGTAATFTINSATQITATVPSTATSGTISVSTPGGIATSASAFTVTPAPIITGFTPTSGPVGVSVTIAGTNLAGATAVLFNGTAAMFSVNSATQISTTVPAGAANGTISVTTSGGTATSTGAFTVTTATSTAPTISSILPGSGPLSGGTQTTITGTDLVAGAIVKIGGILATGVTVVNATTINATTPAHAAGVTDVSIVNPDTQSGLLPGGFQYLAVPHGDANGDGQVTVADVFSIINNLFSGGAAPIGSVDTNGDGLVTVADVFYLINFLFSGGPPPR